MNLSDDLTHQPSHMHMMVNIMSNRMVENLQEGEQQDAS